MSDIIASLRAEHRDMERLLSLLDSQLDLFEQGELPDYEVLQSIMEYFGDYPDSCHHPKEDLVARELEQTIGSTGPSAKKLAALHEDLGRLTHAFADLLDRVVIEAAVPRDEFLRAAREFVSAQRHHMQMEEDGFFPQAEKALSAGDGTMSDHPLLARQDPLFGTEVEARFTALRDRILSYEDQ